MEWYISCRYQWSDIMKYLKKGETQPMKRFLPITSLLVMALALSGVSFAQQKHEAKKATPRKTEATHMAKQKMRTAKGEISAVNASAQTLTLMERGKAVTFAYHDKTAITESGHTVQPSAMTSGTKATVKYTEQDGKNWASSILLHPARPAKQSTPRKKGKS